MALLYFTIQFAINIKWSLLFISLLLALILYDRQRGYIQWQHILKSGTRIER